MKIHIVLSDGLGALDYVVSFNHYNLAEKEMETQRE